MHNNEIIHTLTSGHELYCNKENGEWEIWLNAGVSNYDGLCIGIGSTLGEVVEDVRDILREIEIKLIDLRESEELSQ